MSSFIKQQRAQILQYGYEKWRLVKIAWDSRSTWSCLEKITESFKRNVNSICIELNNINQLPYAFKRNISVIEKKKEFSLRLGY